MTLTTRYNTPVPTTPQQGVTVLDEVIITGYADYIRNQANQIAKELLSVKTK